MTDRLDSQLDMPLHSVFGVCIVCWEIFGKPLAYSWEFSEKERLKMSHLYSKQALLRKDGKKKFKISNIILTNARITN